MDQMRYLLTEREMPESWYNLLADLPFEVPPVLHPGTHQPVGPADLAPLFPMALIQQEVTTERYIPIPEEIRDIYRLWRPTPLHRAYRLEQALGTPAHIYYKYEGVSPSGSHKPNTAVAQAYYNKQEGVRRLTTETGAGQWGTALALAARLFGLEATVYMVRISYEQKPYRRIIMQTYGAEVLASPTERTNAGRQILAEHPDSLGSLGIAISEAVEDAATHDDARYSLGSVLNHVLLHQTIIGEEALKQMELAGEYPDIVVGCVGGGSNFAGISFPFMRDKLKGKSVRIIAVEPEACPTLTRGIYAYDFGDTAGLTPLVKMYTLGHTFVPAGIHAGGLRYHGDSAIVSLLVHEQLMEARAYPQNTVFDAGVLFAQVEGIVPAPEAAHAVKAVFDLAQECRASGERKVILFNLSGHGYFDLSAYDAYLAQKLVDYAYPDEQIQQALAVLPRL
jgi:tryptophan synthase beta chain